MPSEIFKFATFKRLFAICGELQMGCWTTLLYLIKHKTNISKIAKAESYLFDLIKLNSKCLTTSVQINDFFNMFEVGY